MIAYIAFFPLLCARTCRHQNGLLARYVFVFRNSIITSSQDMFPYFNMLCYDYSFAAQRKNEEEKKLWGRAKPRLLRSRMLQSCTNQNALIRDSPLDA
jgi:hypothetical protein